MKYTLDSDGHISEISKIVSGPLGEAVGINFVSKSDVTAPIEKLEVCDESDYF